MLISINYWQQYSYEIKNNPFLRFCNAEEQKDNNPECLTTI